MDNIAQKRYYNLGKDYWWFEGKYNIVYDLIKDHFEERKDIISLDIGCGPGNFISLLKKHGKCFGLDINFNALCYSKSRNYLGVNADVCFFPFKENSVDFVFMLDVLEHVHEEGLVLKGIRRVLKKDGIVILTVPAFKVLYGSHDKLYGHLRRYRVKELEDKVQKAGLKVLKNSYIEPLFFLPLFLVRKLKGAKGKDDFYPLPHFLNVILIRIITLETYLLRKFNFPFGCSIICLARK